MGLRGLALSASILVAAGACIAAGPPDALYAHYRFVSQRSAIRGRITPYKFSEQVREIYRRNGNTDAQIDASEQQYAKDFEREFGEVSKYGEVIVQRNGNRIAVEKEITGVRFDSGPLLDAAQVQTPSQIQLLKGMTVPKLTVASTFSDQLDVSDGSTTISKGPWGEWGAPL